MYRYKEQGRPMIPISRPLIGDAEIQAVQNVLASGQLANGPVCRQFEQEFAQLTGTKSAIATTNGTVAIEVALRCMGIGHGDEVIVPDFTFIATANAVLNVGARPVLVDVDAEQFTIDVSCVEDAIGPTTRAVIGVHLYGNPAPMEALEGICKTHGIRLIGDAAQAHGARIGDRQIGSFGDMETWSFYPTKNIACPEGGMVTTMDEMAATKIRSITNHGRADAGHGAYDHLIQGGNGRLSDVHAAIGLTQLRAYTPRFERRQNIALTYLAAWKNHPIIQLPEVAQGNTHAWHQFTLKMGDRDQFIRYMKSKNIGTGIYYPKPLHDYPHLAAYAHNDLEVSEFLAESVVSVPVHPGLSDEEVKTVTDTVNSW